MTGITDHIRIWIRDTIAKEDEKVRRPHGSQAVCPFAGASLSSGQLNIVVFPGVDGMEVEEIELITLEHLRDFSAKFLADKGVTQLATLILAFPDLRGERNEILDELERKLRPLVLADGLIMGQMHKGGPVRGLYGDSLEVFAPYELLKIRTMVVQDIVFLGHSSERFRYYDAKFAEYFVDGAPSLPQHISILYRSAKERFGQLALCEPAGELVVAN
jgi:hypothetical protein